MQKIGKHLIYCIKCLVGAVNTFKGECNMKIEATYNTSYNNGSVEVVSGHTQIYKDWLSEGEIRDLAIQFKDAYLEFSKNKLLHLIEEALDDAENLESLESEEYSAIIVRLKQAIKLLSE